MIVPCLRTRGRLLNELWMQMDFQAQILADCFSSMSLGFIVFRHRLHSVRTDSFVGYTSSGKHHCIIMSELTSGSCLSHLTRLVAAGVSAYEQYLVYTSLSGLGEPTFPLICGLRGEGVVFSGSFIIASGTCPLCQDGLWLLSQSG